MTRPLEVFPDADTAARRVAELVVERAREAVGRRAQFSLALSRAPAAMAGALDLPWAATTVYQVDERVAPHGHPDRNLTQLLAELPPAAIWSVRPMPVEEPDLEDAATGYAETLPRPLDLVHLGLGPDGHTASLVPGDPVLEVQDRLVAVTQQYRGFRRMTLTYPALEAARELVWLVVGEEKREVLARLLAGDESIPAGRIANANQLVVADRAAGA